MGDRINPLDAYILQRYDNPDEGVQGAVDPKERQEFIRWDLKLDPDSFLKRLQSDPESVRVFFNAWKSQATVRAPYLSDLQLEQFKEALLGETPVAGGQPANVVIMHIGDIRASAQFNSQSTVMAARRGDIPREGRAFTGRDASNPVKFTIELESVNAYRRPKAENGGDSQMLSSSRVYIVPEGYRGKVPPSPREMEDWFSKAKAGGISGPPEKYFMEILPGITPAQSSKYFDNGRGDFSYAIEMPPGSYEVHGVSGEFRGTNAQSDFDNFDIKVTSHNATARDERLSIRIASEAEVEDSRRRQFIETITATAAEQTRTGDVKGETVRIIFVLDRSGSMEPGAKLIRDSVEGVVAGLNRGGAREIWFGVVTFNNTYRDGGGINTLMPLSQMNDENIGKLYKVINNIHFDGGLEPVGEAALYTMEQLKGQCDGSCQIVIVTDDDGLIDDKKYKPTLFDGEVVKAAVAAGVAVNLQKITQDSIQPMIEVVPARYIALLRTAAGSGDKVLVEETRALAFSEDARFSLFKIEVQRRLVPIGEKADLDRICSSPQNVDADMLQSIIARGSIAADALYNLAIKSGDMKICLAAAEALVSIGGGAMSRLGKTLADEKIGERNRIAIAQALAAKGDKAAVGLLVKFANKSPHLVDPNILNLIVSNGVATREVLIEVAGHSRDLNARMEAARHLAGNDEQAAIEEMKKILSDFPNSVEARRVLLAINREKGIAVLRVIMLNLEYPADARLTIAMELVPEGDEVAIDRVRVEAAIDGNPRRFLGLLITGGEEGLKAVRRLALNSNRCDMRLAAALALAPYDKASAVDAIRSVIDNPEALPGFEYVGAKHAALDILVKVDEQEALLVIKGFLRDGDAAKRFVAANVFVEHNLKYPEVKKIVIRVLTELSRNSYYRKVAKELLAELRK